MGLSMLTKLDLLDIFGKHSSSAFCVGWLGFIPSAWPASRWTLEPIMHLPGILSEAHK